MGKKIKKAGLYGLFAALGLSLSACEKEEANINDQEVSEPGVNIETNIEEESLAGGDAAVYQDEEIQDAEDFYEIEDNKEEITDNEYEIDDDDVYTVADDGMEESNTSSSAGSSGNSSGSGSGKDDSSSSGSTSGSGGSYTQPTTSQTTTTQTTSQNTNNNTSTNNQSSTTEKPDVEEDAELQTEKVWVEPVYEQVWVVDHPYTEIKVPVTETIHCQQCNGCNKLLYSEDEITQHQKTQIKNGISGCGGYHSYSYQVETGEYQTYIEPEEGHWEEVLVQEGYWKEVEIDYER